MKNFWKITKLQQRSCCKLSRARCPTELIQRQRSNLLTWQWTCSFKHIRTFCAFHQSRTLCQCLNGLLLEQIVFFLQSCPNLLCIEAWLAHYGFDALLKLARNWRDNLPIMVVRHGYYSPWRQNNYRVSWWSVFWGGRLFGQWFPKCSLTVTFVLSPCHSAQFPKLFVVVTPFSCQAVVFLGNCFHFGTVQANTSIVFMNKSTKSTASTSRSFLLFLVSLSFLLGLSRSCSETILCCIRPLTLAHRPSDIDRFKRCNPSL